MYAGLSGTTAAGLFGSACLAIGCFAPLAAMNGSPGYTLSLLGNGLTLPGAGLAVIAGIGIVLVLAGLEKFLVAAGGAAAAKMV